MRLTLVAARWVTLACLAVPGLACESTLLPPVGALSRVLLTDGPFPYYWIDRVDLYIVSVSVSVAADTGASGNFVTIATPNRRINVMGLANGLTEEIGQAPLPTGAITAVRMVIDTDSSSMTTKYGFVITDKTSPSIQWQSSAGRPVLNALIHEQITVPDTGAIIVIDYDIGRAFIPNRELSPGSPDSGFVFSPTLRAADALRTGTVMGRVLVQTSTGAPVEDVSMRLYFGDPNQPENTWSVMGTAGTDATGAFVFSFVTRSAHWATIPAMASKTYIVAADPRPGSPLGRAIVPNITVIAASETDIGVIVLP